MPAVRLEIHVPSRDYRVNFKRGTEFRIWATNILQQHIVQGYTLMNRNPSCARYLGYQISLVTSKGVAKSQPKIDTLHSSI